MPDPRDDQEIAESVDSEMVSDVDDDPEGSLSFPPDRPLGVEEYGTAGIGGAGGRTARRALSGESSRIPRLMPVGR